MTYYRLECETCKAVCAPVRATSPEELEYPDYDEVETNAGTICRDGLELFHREHRGHILSAVEDAVQ